MVSRVDRSDQYDVDASDPGSRLIDRSHLPADDVAQITELMTAFGELREAENALSEKSQEYMKLNSTDMKALHYLIICKHRDTIGTPTGITEHLAISPAATTKLLDRLEQGGHIHRSPHPTDRRALAISIDPTTYDTAVQTVGRQQARRFHAAARLTRAEREVVIRFLRDTTRELTSTDGD